MFLVTTPTIKMGSGLSRTECIVLFPTKFDSKINRRKTFDELTD